MANARTSTLLGCLALLAATLAMPAAHGQGYPAKPVRVIEPHPAGSILDNLARAFTQNLSQSFGQPFVVENRAGAEGMIGMEACVKAPADGYTLCITDSLVISLNPVVRAKLPYDPPRDLAPIGHFGFLNSAVIVQPSLPVNSMSELLELAKAKPGVITWGTWGVTSLSNLYIEWLKNARGISFYNVPYKGAVLAAQGVLGGQVQVALWGVGAVAPLAKAGKLKALAVVGETRSLVMPQLPTLKESGIDPVLRAWFGLFAPAGTPADIVQRLNAAVAKAMADPGFRERFLLSQGFEIAPPAGGSVGDFGAFLRSDRAMYEQLVKVTGVKAE